MISSARVKQLLTTAVKILIVGLACFFIYDRLAQTANEAVSPADAARHFSWFDALLMLALSFGNRFTEILKWKNLVSSFSKITVAQSVRQVLSAMTVSSITPGGVGEYGAKALYYAKDQAKKVVLLNVVCNGAQLLMTVFFGLFGLSYFNARLNVIKPDTVLYAFAAIVAFFASMFFMKRFSVKGYSIEKLVQKIAVIPRRVHTKNLMLASLRYAFFTVQYFLLFRLFGVEIDGLLLLSAITSIYFLASAIPTFQFLDFAIKGGVAVYFFEILGVSMWIPFWVTTIMWLLNVVIPVMIGSYFVLKFKFLWKSS